MTTRESLYFSNKSMIKSRSGTINETSTGPSKAHVNQSAVAQISLYGRARLAAPKLDVRDAL